MQLRWTERAAEVLDAIADYLFEQTPMHARRIVLEIYEAPTILMSFPLSGRPGQSLEPENLFSSPFLIF